MSFYNGHQSYESEISNIFENLKSDEQLIICTDIQFGSVNQLFIKESLKNKNKNMFIVSGINLPLLLEIVIFPQILTKKDLDEMIEKAKEQITLVDFAQIKTRIEEDFF